MMNGEKKRLIVFLVIAVSIFAAACSGDDDGAEPDGGDTDTIEECPAGMVEIPRLDACVDGFEYTNAEFAEFLNDHGNDCGEAVCRIMGELSHHRNVAGYESVDFTESDGGVVEMAEGVGDNPVSWVTWYGARDACLWEGKTLCPWEVWYAACSQDGIWHFPYGGTTGGVDDLWGYVEDFEANICNDHGTVGDSPVGYLSDCEGAYDGLFDMAGNIAELGGSFDLSVAYTGMGGAYLSFFGGDDGSPSAGAGCYFPQYESGVSEMSTDDPDLLLYSGAPVGFRCCKPLE